MSENRTAAEPNLYGMDREQLGRALTEWGVEPYRARQLMRAFYQRDALEPEGWTDLPGALRQQVVERYRVERPRVAEPQRAPDGTVKALLELPEGGRVEAVAMGSPRGLTFCLSSQVGCAMGCAFCMTAKLGYQRQLTPGEIVGQVAALEELTGCSRDGFNIVFMGMGEPLHNLDGVLGALRLLTDPDGFGLGPRRITVSTVGLVRGIDRLAEQPVVPRLSVSLITADPQQRAELMPIARRTGLDELAAAIRRFGDGRRDIPTLEVVLLGGVNDSERHARLVVRFAHEARAKVNLIPFNATPELPFEPPDEPVIDRFLKILSKAGVVGTVRRSRGREIDAACGQLAFTRRRPA
jgi:23S rRNA (adenine2503-C2)-methyltransferase